MRPTTGHPLKTQYSLFKSNILCENIEDAKEHGLKEAAWACRLASKPRPQFGGVRVP